MPAAVYVNSLLATLNARNHIREIGKEPSTRSGGDPRSTAGGILSRFRNNGVQSGNMLTSEVHVDREVRVDLDIGTYNPHRTASLELQEMDTKSKGSQRSVSNLPLPSL